MAAAIDAPRARALAAGPAAAPVSTPAPQTSPTSTNGATNGNGNGYSGPPPPPPPPPPSARTDQAPPPPGQPEGARTEMLQWFEDAFGELRNELHAVVSSVTRQQAMLAELLDSREAELRVVMVAESLPVLAGEAAAKAVSDQSDGLAVIVAAALDDFRSFTQTADLANVAVMDGMRELLRRVEVTAELNTEAARDEGAARLDALKASLARQLKPLKASVGELADYIGTVEEREAAHTRAVKASVTRQLQPLAAAVTAAVERSDQQLAEIRARLDALGAPKVRAPRKAPAAPKVSAPRKATATPEKSPAAPKKAVPVATPRAATKKRPAPAPPEPEPEASTIYDDEAPPPAPFLLRRRARPGA